jgi:hypothetical protein
MYSICMPDKITKNLPDINWVINEYEEQADLLAMVWDAQRALLEHYAWTSLTLLGDTQPWRECDWNKYIVELVQDRLQFLNAPRRGCIIGPTSHGMDLRRN